MATRKKKQPRMTNRTEFRFVIAAYTPATIPMARLGEYLTELAILLGEPKAVHFRTLDEGSTVPVVDVEHEAVPKVRARVEGVRLNGGAAPEATLAAKTLNHMLREDNATGKLIEKRVRKPILTFPGRLQQVVRPLVTHRHGTIDGELVRLGGTDQTIHAILMSEGQQITNIEMNKLVAKQLAPRMFEIVRLAGHGRWERSSEGQWALKQFKVDSFETLDTAPLSKVLKQLGNIGTGWDDATALRELKDLRDEADASD